MSLLVIQPLSFPDLSANCMPAAKTTLKLFFAGDSVPAQKHELRFLKLASCQISERKFTRIAVLPTALLATSPAGLLATAPLSISAIILGLRLITADVADSRGHGAAAIKKS